MLEEEPSPADEPEGEWPRWRLYSYVLRRVWDSAYLKCRMLHLGEKKIDNLEIRPTMSLQCHASDHNDPSDSDSLAIVIDGGDEDNTRCGGAAAR